MAHLIGAHGQIQLKQTDHQTIKRQQVRKSGHNTDNKGRDSSREVEMRESKVTHSNRISK